MKNLTLKSIVLSVVIAAASLSAMATSSLTAEPVPITQAATVEYMHFSLIEGANPDDFLRETLAVDSILESYEGFVARHLARNADGTWVEVVYWKTLKDAEEALPRFVKDERTKGFLALVDGETLSVKYSTLFEF